MHNNIQTAAKALGFLAGHLDEAEEEVKLRLAAVIRAQNALSQAIQDRDAFLAVFVKTAKVCV